MNLTIFYDYFRDIIQPNHNVCNIMITFYYKYNYNFVQIIQYLNYFNNKLL